MEVLKNPTPYSPEEVGYDPAQLDKIDAMYQRLIGEEEIQCGCYVLSRYGKIFASRSMGPLRGFEDKGTLRTDSIRSCASMTKVFTAAAIMQLVEKGDLVLDAPVTDVLDEFKTWQHKYITFQQLLTHTSGMPADPGALMEPYPDWGSWDKGRNWIEQALSGPMQYELGEKWNYFSGGFVILAEVVSRLSGMTYQEYMQKNIFEPLNMKRTFYEVPTDLHDEVSMVQEREKEWLNRKWDKALDPPPGASGLYSTAEDLQRFSMMMLNRGSLEGVKILNPLTVDHMTRNQLGDDVTTDTWACNARRMRSGLGWWIAGNRLNLTSPTTFKHEGAGAGGMYNDPEEQFALTFYVPSKDNWNPGGVFGSLGVVWAGIE